MFYEKPEMEVIFVADEEVMTLIVSEETDGETGGTVINPF